MEKRTTNISELDTILKGGIFWGSLVEISGEPGIGKSCLSLLLSKGYSTVYLDTEFSYFNDMAHWTRGEEEVKDILIGRPNTVEDTINIILSNVGNTDYIILDSFASVYQNHNQIKEFFNQILKPIGTSTTTLIVINQLRNKMHSTRKKRLGTKGLDYLYDIILRLDNKHKVKNGYRYDINVVKNRNSFVSGDKITFTWEEKC